MTPLDQKLSQAQEEKLWQASCRTEYFAFGGKVNWPQSELSDNPIERTWDFDLFQIIYEIHLCWQRRHWRAFDERAKKLRGNKNAKKSRK